MPLMARDNQKTLTPAPEGLHQAVCVDVVDLGMVQTPWGPKPQVELRWQLEEVNPESGKRYLVVKRYGLTLHEKAGLRKHLEAWRGRAFTKEELAGFDLERLLEANGQIQVVHTLTSKGNVFAEVQAIVPLGKGMTKLRAEEYVRVKDRQASQGHGEATVSHEDETPF